MKINAVATIAAVLGGGWVVWTLLEGVMKILSTTLQKVIGNVNLRFADVAFFTLLIGLVQTIGSIGWHRNRPKSTGRKALAGTCLYGGITTASTLLGPMAYALGADMTAHVFVLSMFVLPGLLIDRVVFHKSPSPHQWAGIVVGVMAAYVMLAPTAEGMRGLPPWLFLSFSMMIVLAIAQGISQFISREKINNGKPNPYFTSPMGRNYYGGLTTSVIAGSIWLVCHLCLYAPLPSLTVIVSGLLTGGIVIIMWVANAHSYSDNKAILGAKKTIMNGCYLGGVTIVGFAVFGQPLTAEKLIGILLFLVSFPLLIKQR
ncbi:hypothetical protein A2477_03720 [Candidatus Falkowbacteria bacterium RIFOXYC2_FULL_47_12]|uniref:EamA domain-containing protein n=2 Tax=Candidatus Falkowiibacteriota TaxID=1752728 RepID=A0A1F5TNV8_9BACT|nr:MAG: hypothetical protein A2242_03755 [Candidatus Falkowbacteria bacterium RIFOXYA2_FULL_47_9]OGF40586.1 MAG: hypothetical protein A2477_03720 [Candidatus Falkowbacteria bacterium RIFOXYC2_FULL_47_12]